MATKRFVSLVWKDFQQVSGMEPTLLNNLRIVDAVPGKVTLGLKIEKKHTNRLQILHGATIAALVDLGGSLAVASRGLFSTGVSTDLNVSYLSSGGKVDDEVFIECNLDRMGRTLAFTQMNFFNGKHQQRLFARGSHTKYIANALKDPLNQLDNHRPSHGSSEASKSAGTEGNSESEKN